MLTNLNWLEPGQQYPPPSEVPRIKRYEQNEKLFLTQHTEVWQTDFDSLARRLHKSDREVQAIFNYQQLLTKKTADFVCGEPPEIETGQQNDNLDALLRQQRFWGKLYEGFIDVSRFGNAIMKLVDNRASIASPRYWFPIVAPSDLKHITHQVIAYPTEYDTKGQPTQLYVEIHTPGSIEIRQYALDCTGFSAGSGVVGRIGNLIRGAQTQQTGLPDFAVQVLSNITHSGSLFGVDDYAIINSLVERLMWRLHCADTILDKHSDPSMSGPQSALTWDDKFQRYYLDLGKYFKRDTSEDPDLKYITWDGNLDANFKEIDLLFNQIYILSEMGTAFMEGNDGGNASSGTALKLRMVSPRIKAQRLAGINDSAVRTLIQLLAQANGVTVSADDLQLTWHDGLPNDPVEDANRWSVESAGRQTKSLWTILKERGLSDEDTEAELEQIRLEQAAAMPQALVTDPTVDEV